ncbi:hypothetical protein BpHYR1_030354 [Brachionus plicatilis]|uniref:Uncharacterized protein n=1 Tax=Brachionus plicatilis TaxID=10195 RepID=A0A3M7RBJ1_BRAPC|nr:hypothetical protein BpHYR1_030354 [Brachionus plicatilis]
MSDLFMPTNRTLKPSLKLKILKTRPYGQNYYNRNYNQFLKKQTGCIVLDLDPIKKSIVFSAFVIFSSKEI